MGWPWARRSPRRTATPRPNCNPRPRTKCPSRTLPSSNIPGRQLLQLLGLLGVRYVQGHIAESGGRSPTAPVAPESARRRRRPGRRTSRWLDRRPAWGGTSSPHADTSPWPTNCAGGTALGIGTRVEVHRTGLVRARLLAARPRQREALHWCNWAVQPRRGDGAPLQPRRRAGLAGSPASCAATSTRRNMGAPREEVCARYDFAYYGNWGLILAAGAPDCGTEGLDWPDPRRPLHRLRSPGALARQPYYLSLLAETLLSPGQSPDWLRGRRGIGARGGALRRQSAGGCRSSTGSRRQDGAADRGSAAPGPVTPPSRGAGQRGAGAGGRRPPDLERQRPGRPP